MKRFKKISFWTGWLAQIFVFALGFLFAGSDIVEPVHIGLPWFLIALVVETVLVGVLMGVTVFLRDRGD